jgi:hypothetical protein
VANITAMASGEVAQREVPPALRLVVLTEADQQAMEDSTAAPWAAAVVVVLTAAPWAVEEEVSMVAAEAVEVATLVVVASMVAAEVAETAAAPAVGEETAEVPAEEGTDSPSSFRGADRSLPDQREATLDCFLQAIGTLVICFAKTR